MRRALVTFAAVIVAIGALGLSAALPADDAAAATSATPTAVGAWFRSKALVVIHDTATSGKTLSDDSSAFASATGIGRPRRVDTWSSAFLTRAAHYSSPTARSTYWIAPVMASSSVIGTIVAADTAGGVAFVSYDDQADLGVGLARLPSTSMVVADPELSSWVSLRAGRVRALTAMTAVDLPGSMSLATYRGILQGRHASAATNSKGKTGATGGGGPVIPVPQHDTPLDAVSTFGGGAFVLLGAGGLALYLRGKRRARSSIAG